MRLSPQTFDELRRLIHRLCGLVIPDEKAYLIQHRLVPLVRQRGLNSFEELALELQGTTGLALQDTMIEAITTAETSFFRDAHVFETFRQHLLPELTTASKRTRRGGMPARIRCAAASTGQEPYTVAMLVHDHIVANRALGVRDNDVAILATDISARVLAVAQYATYTQRELERGLTPAQIVRYFEKRGDGWVVIEPVRRLVEFRRLNLISPPAGLSTFDVIFCRNLLIYFDDATRRRVCRHLYSVLAPGGWLVLGSAENLYGIHERFESLTLGATLVYRKPAGAEQVPLRS